MDKLFFSKYNFELIHKIVAERVKETYDTEIDNQYNDTMVKAMEYVYEKVGNEPPKGVTQKQCLDMMNVKILSLVLPKIVKSLDPPKQPPISPLEQERQSIDPRQQFFEPSKMENKLPMPVSPVYHDDVNQEMDKLESERRGEMMPPPQPSANIPISESQLDKPTLEEATQRYNQMMQNRGINQSQSQSKGVEDLLENLFPKDDEVEINRPQQVQKLEPFSSEPNHATVPPPENIKTINSESSSSFDPLFSTSQAPELDIVSNREPISILSPEITNREYQPAFHPNTVSNVENVILPKKTKYIKKINWITMDSRDRDLEIYPDPNHFQVKFSPANNAISPNVTELDNVAYETRDEIVGDKGASIPRTYDNILFIFCSLATVPNDNIFVCGICPNKYYGPEIDAKKCPPRKDLSYQPIWNKEIGTITTVLDEPYLILNIPELESYNTYEGTNTTSRNAFAKLVYDTDFGLLNSFIKMRTSEPEEFYYYSPTALGKIDKFTLNLLTTSGKPFNFGRDKLFIKSFGQGSPIRGTPKDMGPIPSTRVTISKSFAVCKCRNAPDCDCHIPITSHCLKPGDLIFIYDTKPCDSSFVVFYDPKTRELFKNFEIKIVESDSNKTTLQIDLIKNEEIKHAINFSIFLDVDDFLALRTSQGTFLYQVIDLNNDTITVLNNVEQDITEDLEVSNVGRAKRNNKGIQTENKDTLNSQFGIRVCNLDDKEPCDEEQNELHFDIEFPFDMLSPSFLENYVEGDMFLIKQKLQISYTFKICTLEKDYYPIESFLVGP